MDKNLLDLFHKNLFKVNISGDNKEIKKGSFYDYAFDTIEYRYIKNLCMEKSEVFSISKVNNLYTKICMMISYNDFSYIEDNILIDHEIIGVVPINSHIPVLHVKINSSICRETYPYKTRTHSYDFKVTKLTIEEQICLIFNMLKTYKTETNLQNRNLKVNAYLDRLLFSENDKHPLLTRIIEYYNSITYDEYIGLERILEEDHSFTLEELLKFPLVFKRDLEIQLGLVYYKCGFYEKAKEIFKRYDLHREEIKCLIALRKTDEAIKKINLELSKIETDKSFKKRVLYCEYCIKLGWITENIELFDKGFEAYSSFEPVEQKAIFYYKLKDYKNAKLTYEKALEIVPKNERILFAYGSVKILLEEYFDCIDIFKRLLENDKKNSEYLRNLSLCYYHVEDIENCMTSLKLNAISDHKSMEMYFKLVIKHNRKDEILWCIGKLDDVRHIEPFIRYLVKEQIITLEETSQAFLKNPKLRDIKFEI